MRMRRLRHLVAMLSMLAILRPAIASADISSFAFVREDGTLQISGNIIRLYGIYIPPTEQTCYTFIRPVKCANRASLALDLKISGDFVRCTTRMTHSDGSITASCTAGEDDLSEWMLQKGWAVALPDAPFSYAALEKIARSRGVGIWGIPVEQFRRK